MPIYTMTKVYSGDTFIAMSLCSWKDVEKFHNEGYIIIKNQGKEKQILNPDELIPYGFIEESFL